MSKTKEKKPEHFSASVNVVDSGAGGILVHLRAEDSEGNLLIFEPDSAMVNRSGDTLLVKATRSTRSNECLPTG